jgi:hypothetical protein
MAALTTLAFVAGAGLYAYGTNESMKESQKARQATERGTAQTRLGFEAESRKADIQNVRAVRSQIRTSRLAQGTMTNVGAQTGGMGGSGVAGGIASVGSQLGSNLSYMSDIAKTNTAIGEAALGYSTEMANASIFSSKAQDAAALASVGSMAFSTFGGPKAVAKYLS